jgi:hypothetical protein
MLLILVAALVACNRTTTTKPTQAQAATVKPQAQPVAITGGMQIPDGPFIHVFGPGPDGKTLPVSGFPYNGLNAEPATIGNFDGFTALAYVAGEATGSDGRRYLLETDMRAFKGTYRTADGVELTGTFGFI